MPVFDVKKAPPTRQELEGEKTCLTALKKHLIKASIWSDAVHGLLFLAFYWADLISGYALLVAIGLGTIVAVVLAASLQRQLRRSDTALVTLCALVTVVAVSGILVGVMREPLWPGVLAGLASGSLVVAGAVIGRKLFHVFTSLENLRSVAEEEESEQELLALCSQYPELANYRQQARDLLRPNLTIGELKAMRDWLREG